MNFCHSLIENLKEKKVLDKKKKKKFGRGANYGRSDEGKQTTVFFGQIFSTHMFLKTAAIIITYRNIVIDELYTLRGYQPLTESFVCYLKIINTFFEKIAHAS